MRAKSVQLILIAALLITARQGHPAAPENDARQALRDAVTPSGRGGSAESAEAPPRVPAAAEGAGVAAESHAMAAHTRRSGARMGGAGLNVGLAAGIKGVEKGGGRGYRRGGAHGEG